VRITLSLLSSPTGTAKALPISFTDLRPLPINHHSNSHSVENQHDTTDNVGDRQQVSPPEVWKVTIVKIPSTELWEEPTMQRRTNYFIMHNEWTHLKLKKNASKYLPDTWSPMMLLVRLLQEWVMCHHAKSQQNSQHK
jgi:hypothetical protein